MRIRTAFRPLLVAALAAGVLVPLQSAGARPAASAPAGTDAVVVAVIDSGISPYHWDFLASKMPQARTPDRSDDLPLTQPPHTWLKGFPSPKAFKTYSGLKLTLPDNDEGAKLADLRKKDDAAWKSIKHSGPDAVNYYWFPGTKVIGGLSFGYEEQVTQGIDQATAPAPVVGFTYEPVYGTGHVPGVPDRQDHDRRHQGDGAGARVGAEPAVDRRHHQLVRPADRPDRPRP